MNKVIKKIMREKKLTQKQLSSRLKYHQTYISSILLGKRNISLKFAKRVEKVFPEYKAKDLLGL